jgi:excisionase family DNA binding protein
VPVALLAADRVRRCFMAAVQTTTVPPLTAVERAVVRGVLDEFKGRFEGAASIALDGDEFDLPAPARAAIIDVLARFARGDSVLIGSVDELVTTSQAADLLGISRTYVVQLIERGVLDAQFRGTHRRLRVADVLAYGEQRHAERAEALDEVARVSRKAGLYDDEC